jgi:uncharacterized protein YegJ (DUF2314 family)
MACKELFGFADKVKVFEHDAKMIEAKKKALAALGPYEAVVKKGIPQGHILLVKAPFKHEGGTEWMWVAVESWSGGVLKGTLENEPETVRDVAAGAKVTVQLNELMDYIYQFPDGTFLGNETGKVMAPESFAPAENGRWRIVRD